jgi:hypothetical protein
MAGAELSPLSQSRNQQVAIRDDGVAFEDHPGFRPEDCTLRCQPASNLRVALPPDDRNIPVGHCAPVPASR